MSKKFGLCFVVLVLAHCFVHSEGRCASLTYLGSRGAADLTITTAFLLEGTAGTPYMQDLKASGGTPPYSRAVAAETLPPGLSLSATGTISGTATKAGTHSFTVRVGDPTGDAQKALSIVVKPATMVKDPPKVSEGAKKEPQTVAEPANKEFQHCRGTSPPGELSRLLRRRCIVVLKDV